MTTTPETIGRYRIRKRIGKGGEAEVYLAHDPAIDREVAIKVRRGFETDEIRGGFESEVRAVGRLNHPNIVQVYDVFDADEDSVVIVMEFVAGQTLEDVVRNERVLSTSQILWIVEQICKGLAEAHANGIIHRDIKPANVMLGAQNAVKILDFGIARFGSSRNTIPDQVRGTLPYMAPEQLQQMPTTAQTDMFATCLIAYELLTGSRAYQGSRRDIIAAATHGRVPELKTGDRVVAPEIAAMLRRGLAAEPADRFPDMLALKRECARLRLALGDATADTIVSAGGRDRDTLVVRPPEPATIPNLAPRRGATFSSDASAGVFDDSEALADETPFWKRSPVLVMAGVLLAALVFLLWPTSNDNGPAEVAVATTPTREVVPQGSSEPPPSNPAGRGPQRGGATTRPGPQRPIDPPISQGGSGRDLIPLIEPPGGSAAVAGSGGELPTNIPLPPSEEETPRPLVEPEPARVVAEAPPPDAPKPPAPLTLSPQDEEGVRSTLRAFEQAFENLSSAALKLVQPSLTPNQLSVWDRAFLENAVYRVSVIGPRIRMVSANEIAVDCAIDRTYTPKRGGDARTITTKPAVILLSRAAAGWNIASIRGRGWGS